MLRITPPMIELYPDDIQRFTLGGEPPPSGWRAITNATIEADGSLQIVNGAAGQSAVGWQMHQLRSGTGTLEYVIDDQAICTGTGALRVDIADGVESAKLRYSVEDNGLKITDPLGGTVTITGGGTISLAIAVGDVIRIELAGNRWSCLLNGEEKAYAVPNTAITYPIYVTVTLIAPFQATPGHVPPFNLTGDWAIFEQADWLVENGLFSGAYLDDPWIDYVVSGLPGTYTITATIEDSIYQTATATVKVPPLMILGERVIEAEPGYASGALTAAVIQFEHNYAKAQTFQLVAWSETGTGSFSNPLSGIYGRYTAPTAAGDVTVTATVVPVDGNDQKDTVTVRVPEVLMPNLSVISPSENIDWVNNMTGANNWGGGSGVINSSTNSTMDWTGPATVGVITRVEVENVTSGRVLYQDLEVLDAFPVPYSFLLPFKEGPGLLLDSADDQRTAWSRTKAPIGFTPKAWDVSAPGLTPDQYDTLSEFLDTYARNGGRFFITDYARSSTRETVRVLPLDGEGNVIEGEPAGDCLISARCRVRRA